jgi:hypothetical protein
MSRRIQSICPAAPGWRAVLRDGSGAFERPIVCWAVVRDVSDDPIDAEMGARVVHFVSAVIPCTELESTGGTELACNDGNFLGIAGPGETAESVLQRHDNSLKLEMAEANSGGEA